MKMRRMFFLLLLLSTKANSQTNGCELHFITVNHDTVRLTTKDIIIQTAFAAKIKNANALQRLKGIDIAAIFLVKGNNQPIIIYMQDAAASTVTPTNLYILTTRQRQILLYKNTTLQPSEALMALLKTCR